MNLLRVDKLTERCCLLALLNVLHMEVGWGLKTLTGVRGWTAAVTIHSDSDMDVYSINVRIIGYKGVLVLGFLAGVRAS